MKKLKFEVDDCDGGEYSSSYSVSNLLNDDDQVYCSKKKNNVNILFKIKSQGEFILNEYKVTAPQTGFTCPVGSWLIWVLSKPPSLSDFNNFDNYSQEDFDKLVDINGKDENYPVSYFKMDKDFQVTVKLPTPVKGKYIFIKVLDSSVKGYDNIDIQEISFFGSLETKIKGGKNHLEFLKSEMKNPKYSDLIVIVNGKEIFGHKVIFSQCKKLDIYSKKEIKLDGMKEDLFDEILNLLYTGNCKISEKNFSDLLTISNEIEFDELKNSCFDYIIKTQCTQKNVCQLLKDAKNEKFGKSGLDILIEKCEQLISTHAEKIFESKGFLSLDPDLLLSILKMNNLCVDELTIFNCLIKYGNHNRKDLPLGKFLEPFIPYIRFPFISSDDLILIVKSSGIVPIQYYLDALEWQISPESVKVDGIQFKERGGMNKFIFDIKSGLNPTCFSLTDKNMTVKKISGGNTWTNAMVYGSLKMNKGKYYYEYKINHINNDHSGFAIGLTTSTINQTQYSSDLVIGLSGYQYGLTGSNSTNVNAGDKVGVYVDFQKMKFWFFHNGTQMSCTGTLLKNTTYYPVVHLYYVNDGCTLSFPTKQPKPK